MTVEGLEKTSTWFGGTVSTRRGSQRAVGESHVIPIETEGYRRIEGKSAAFLMEEGKYEKVCGRAKGGGHKRDSLRHRELEKGVRYSGTIMVVVGE